MIGAPIKTWLSPKPHQIAPTVEAFLHQLGEPTILKVAGKDKTKTRVIATLLHGNEASGVKAIHRWLREGHQPAVNILCVIASVKTALTEPLFSHRYLPGRKDLNRCFRAPFIGNTGTLAQRILNICHTSNPECMIDIHNTSTNSPPFSVAIRDDASHRALASLFTNQMVLTDLRLGALMELSETLCPTVTIECGGIKQEEADEIAYQGILSYISKPQILDSEKQVTVSTHPLRITIKPGTSFTYAPQSQQNIAITLKANLEQKNFQVTGAQKIIGWTQTNSLNSLQALNAKNQNVINDILTVNQNGEILTRKPLQLFMVTTNKVIAEKDCLFYVIDPTTK